MCDQQLYQVVVDGIAWIDADGASMWPLRDASALADHCERQGYHDVDAVPA
jgi:hypothetical protein